MDDLTPPGGPAPQKNTATVPAGRGSAWWSEGWRLFVAAPGIWIAITLIFVAIMAMMSLIPMIGSLATTLLAPVFAGGVMQGCRAIDRGDALAVNHLFASFSDRLGPLVVVGVLYLAGTLAIMVLVCGALVATIGIGGFGALMRGDPFEAGYAMLATLGIGALLAVLFGLLLGIPLVMAYWFAPALVVFRNDEPLAAMKASFNASLVNMLPMLVYSLLGLAFAIVASIPILLGWLVLAPVFAGSVYASYKDIFGTPE
jgi:uncharacterized membrane protein